MRILGDDLSKNLNVPVVIVNKPGAGGVIGVQYAASSKPDGYTLLGGTNAIFVIIPAIQDNIPFKTSDFIPIARLGISPDFILVRKEAPWKTLEELIDYGKKNPGKLTCRTAGVGTIAHFVLEMLKIEAGVNIQHVPFKTVAAYNTAFLGGHIDLLSSTLPPVQGFIKSGEMRALVVATVGRIPWLPEIPTFSEKGYGGANLGMWTGLFAPKGVEKSVLEKISREVEKILKTPHVIKKIEEAGYQYDYVAGEDFAREIEKESKKIQDVVKKANLIVK